jgi:hypothetical protein
MKQAFEAGEGPPDSKANSPAPKTPRKATPKKPKTDTPNGEATPTPKRKRASPKKKAVNDGDDSEIKPKPEGDNEDTPDIKKLKVTTPKATPKKRKADEMDDTEQQEIATATPNTIVTEFIKSEIEDELEGTFIDATEWVNDHVPGSDDDYHPGREYSPEPSLEELLEQCRLAIQRTDPEWLPDWLPDCYRN